MKNQHKKIMSIVIILVIFGIYSGYTKENIFSRFFEDRPSQIALRYYLDKYSNQDTEGVYSMARRLGCHDEILIYSKDGKQLMKLSYANGRIYELDY